jgi:hypothetical protein
MFSLAWLLLTYLQLPVFATKVVDQNALSQVRVHLNGVPE